MMNISFRFITSALIILLYVQIISGQTYSCPALTADPIVVPAGSGASFTRQINKSNSNTVCVLLRVVAKTGNANLNIITRNSNAADFNIVPVARSYNNRNWERVAGPYAQNLEVNNCCSVVIPSLSNLQAGKFILMSFSHSVTNKEKVSRFFQQTTFGPTMAMINSWNYGNNILSEMGKWVKRQVNPNQVSPTSHRQYFRERVDFSTYRHSAYKHYRPRHPCGRYARWREYAFDIDDSSQPATVSLWNGKYLVKINDIPRTVISPSDWEYADGQNIGVGNFYICWAPEERVGGWVGVMTDFVSQCQWFRNPTVDLPSAVINQQIKQVSLPANTNANFGSIDPIQFPENEFYGEDLYLKQNIPTNGCSNIPDNGDYWNTLGTFPDGKQAWFAGNVQLDRNTLDNPLSDGGAAMMKIKIPSDEVYYDDVGAQCPVPSKSFINVDTCYLSTNNKACSSAYTKQNNGDAVVVCGSPGEVENNPLNRKTFTFWGANSLSYDADVHKGDVWTMIALSANDQLRQRMAWALSQILIVSFNQIDDIGYSEVYLNYYDIFVRNAFGNYFDILKEVSYSPMMAEMLSFLDSKSATYVLETTGSKSYPDENYAREIMQLFSLGLYELNVDGTLKQYNGEPKLTYTNADIQNFARAWTGFERQNARSNFEVDFFDYDSNRIDPMNVRGVSRDPFPKTDLHNGYIGDNYPLCVDLPERHFLKKGATYQLLGSSLSPGFHEVNRWWDEEDMPDLVLVLPSTSNLKNVLLSKTSRIVLNTDLTCRGRECNVDTLRIVQIEQNPPIYYEYVQQPCVELPYYDTGKKISTVGWDDPARSMCANKNIAAAYDVCCEDTSWNGGTELCKYDLEKTTYSTARTRCTSEYSNGDLCDIYWVDSSDTCATADYWKHDKWYWTNQDCTIKVKVNDEGMAAIVHQPSLYSDSSYSYSIDLRVHPDNTNYVNIHWDSNSYPKASNSCANGACQSVYKGCLCEIEIEERNIFTQLPTANAIMSQLKIGAFNPEILDSYSNVPTTGNVAVWHKNGVYDKNTIFRINYRGKQTYFKNVLSTVKIKGAAFYKFRNPPSFLNLGFREPRDAIYETDSVLENYFYHDNVGPFLAIRLIQRFGVSNPSPRYIEEVAIAFKEGTYPNPDPQGSDFGDGRYGNLEAMAAAIVLDPEASSSVLDADPTSGSLAEPVIKLTRFMRAMEYENNDSVGERISLLNLQTVIGQEVHRSPSVFSFFLPEYSAPGHIKAAEITSPEAQILSGPKIINFLNGIISLVDLGLTECYSGFGDVTTWWCDGLESYYDETERNKGILTYSSSNPNNAASVVDDLSLLLTGGRLNSSSRTLIINAYNSVGNNADGLRLAQKLFSTTPEFHSSNLFNSNNQDRPEMNTPSASNKRYKAVVFMFLDGGIDSHNILVPYSGCSGGKTSYNHYKTVRGAISVPQNDLLQIDASTSSQVCTKFGIHPNLPHLKSLYDDGDLLWVANMGVLQEKVTKDNWYEKTDKTALFAHNTQADEVAKMDMFDTKAGRGVGGRMIDVLSMNGWSSGALSINGLPKALVSSLGRMIVLDPYSGFSKLNPIPWAQNVLNNLKKLNKATNLGSGLFGETWSNLLYQAFGENELLYDSYTDSSVSTTFPDNDLGVQMETVSKLIKIKNDRGAERDVFYVAIGGFDTHDDIKQYLDERTQVINSGLQAFSEEMKSQNKWDDVTVVMVSEFARTLTGNTGVGSDHAWGGNYFIAGGEVRGKRILGDYPNNLSDDGPLVFEPGIVIPTLSWDSIWNGVAQWFGITNEDDLDEVLPNRNKFTNDLFNQNDLFTTGSPPSPTPTPPSSCVDGSLRFKITKNDGKKVMRNCVWVANKLGNRCTFTGVSSACPSSCGTCDVCEDSTLRFKITKSDGRKIMRDCSWVSNKNTVGRCSFTGVPSACPSACGTCSVCEDSTLRFKITKNDGKKILRYCGWVSNKNTVGRCALDGVSLACRDTCGTC